MKQIKKVLYIGRIFTQGEVPRGLAISLGPIESRRYDGDALYWDVENHNDDMMEICKPAAVKLFGRLLPRGKTAKKIEVTIRVIE